jgi:hypothetical protein
VEEERDWDSEKKGMWKDVELELELNCCVYIGVVYVCMCVCMYVKKEAIVKFWIDMR